MNTSSKEVPQLPHSPLLRQRNNTSGQQPPPVTGTPAPRSWLRYGGAAPSRPATATPLDPITTAQLETEEKRRRNDRDKASPSAATPPDSSNTTTGHIRRGTAETRLNYHPHIDPDQTPPTNPYPQRNCVSAHCDHDCFGLFLEPGGPD